MIKEGSKYKKTKGDGIEIEVGDTKQVDFYPQIKSKHWANESNFSLRLKEDIVGATYSDKKGIVEWAKGDLKARFYNKDEGFENGGFEFEVEFATKPISNVVEFTIESKGLVFYKQNLLTNEELIVVSQQRTEAQIESYAVFHDSKKDNKYKTGKAFHIFRPDIIDKDNNKVWCNMDIVGDTLKITIPQNFLDTATYPIILDPTFGYTTIGGTTTGTITSNTYLCTKFTSAADGTIDDINWYINALGNQNMTMGAYDEAGGVPVNIIADSGSSSITNGTGWVTKTASGSITNTDIFYLNGWVSFQSVYYYDSGGTAQTFFKDGTSGIYPTWQDPATTASSFTQSIVFSVYANYTATVSATTKQFGLLGVG
jgi:hypothetical protein